MAKLLTPDDVQTFIDDAGQPLAGGKLFTYLGGTAFATPLQTFADRAGSAPNTNPIILNARGEATIYLTAGTVYDWVLKDSSDVVIRSRVGILADGDLALREDLAAGGTGQGAELVRWVDPFGPAFLKVSSDIANGVPVDALRAISPTLHSAIRAGTDATNHRTSFLNLLTDMGTANRGEIRAPRGIFTITGGSLNIPAGITVRGEGRSKSVLKFTSAGQNGIVLGQGSEAHGISVDGSNAAVSCFLVSSTYGAVISGCDALNAAAHGFALSNSYACQLDKIRTLTAGSRGLLLDPYSYDNEISSFYAKDCANAALLIGHGSRGNNVVGVTAINTGNAAIWLHNECYDNNISNIRIKDTTAASGTPAMLIGYNAYGNTVSAFNIRSYEVGVLLRAAPVDATYTAGHTRRNVIRGGVLTGTGAGVAGSAALKLDSLDSGTTKTEFNILSDIIATDFNIGINDASGVGMFDNHIHDIDLSTNITTKWSAATKNARNRIHNIRGYTPFGDLTALAPPAVAATGVAVTNPFAFPAQIYVKGMPAGGQVQIDGGYVAAGTSPNDGNGMYIVGPQQTIILNYASGSPSWIWFGL